MKIGMLPIVFLVTMTSCSAAWSGEYSEAGVVSMVKSNADGYCWGDIKMKNWIQAFEWDCKGDAGRNMLSTATAAYLSGVKVSVILEGNGAWAKPLRAISMLTN